MENWTQSPRINIMEKNIEKGVYVFTARHFAVQQNPAPFCRSTILQQIEDDTELRTCSSSVRAFAKYALTVRIGKEFVRLDL